MEALDPQLAQFLDVLANSGEPRISEQSPAQARERVRSWLRAAKAEVPDIHRVTELTIPGPGGELRTRLYQPSEDAPFLTVYFHGGGWVVGDLDTSDKNARRLALNSGGDVLSIDYRLAPEHPFPAAVEDALASVDYAGECLAHGRALAVAGESAGGNLAAVCGLRRSRAHGGDVSAQVLIYPVTDHDLDRPSMLANPTTGLLGRVDMAWCWDLYAPNPADRDRPEACPLLEPDLSGAASAVIVIAGHDPLHDEGLAYSKRLEAAGVQTKTFVYESAPHGFISFAGVFDLSTKAAEAMGHALRDIVIAAGGYAPRTLT